MSWHIDNEALKALPACHQEIARRLIPGSRYVRSQFASHQRRVIAYNDGRQGWILTPSLGARLTHVGEVFRVVGDEITYTLRQAVREYYLLGGQPTNLQKGQKPEFAIGGCSDSRNRPSAWLLARTPGQVFSFQNIGGSFEDPNDPERISTDAEEFIAYARHIGVGKLIIFTHGKCGCMANAVNPDHVAPLNADATLEQRIIRRMADRKSHILKAVKNYGEAYFLGKLDAPPVEGEERTRLAAEIAHGIHTKKLAKDFIRELDKSDGRTGDPSMEVLLVHKELRTMDAHIWNPREHRFMRLTNHEEIPDLENRRLKTEKKSKTCGHLEQNGVKGGPN